MGGDGKYYNPDTTTLSIITTLLINLAIGIIVYLLFVIFKPKNKEVYAPRCRSKPNRTPPYDPNLNWIWQLLQMSEEDTLKYIGMDAYVCIRFLQFCAKVCGVCGFLGGVVLIPIYFTAKLYKKGVAGINLWTMANVSNEGDRLWASVAFCWIFTLVFLYFIHKEYEYFSKIRVDFLCQGDVDIPQQVNYSVLIENIPKDVVTSADLKAMFESVFPREVHSTVKMNQVKRLDLLLKRRSATLINLEHAVAYHEANDRSKRQVVKLKGGKVAMCGGDQEADAIEFYTEELRKLNARIAREKKRLIKGEPIDEAQEQELAQSDANDSKVVPVEKADEVSVTASEQQAADKNPDLSNVGIITFTTRHAQSVACQMRVLHDKFDLYVRPAVAVSEIYWGNVDVDRLVTLSGRVFTKALFGTGLIFWATIISFIAAVSQLSNLEKYLTFVSQLDPVSYSILAGILPVAIMSVFLGLLPLFFELGATYIERQKYKSDIQFEIFNWYFKYQIANIFIFVLSGSIFNSLADAVSQPQSIITLLGSALPGVSVFFINFIISGTLSGIPLTLFQAGPLIITNLYLRVFNQKGLTQRDALEGFLAPKDFTYGAFYPAILFVMIVVLIYWVIAPLVTISGFFYFAFLFLVLKHQFLYVFEPAFESGGKFWFGLYANVMGGLMASSICMIGYVSIKQGAQAPILLPLPFIIYYCWGYTKDKFEARCLNVPYTQTVEIDEKLSKNYVASFKNEFYSQPAMNCEDSLQPVEYRVNDIPLFDDKKELNQEYYVLNTASKKVENYANEDVTDV